MFLFWWLMSPCGALLYSMRDVQVSQLAVESGRSSVALLGLGYFVPMALTMAAILARFAHCCAILEAHMRAYLPSD